jgi:predicted ester cyclase
MEPGCLDVVDEVLAHDAVDRHEHPQDDFRSHLKEAIVEFRTGFSDLRATVEDMVAEGDRVAMRVLLTGTHDGRFCGTPPTGKKIRIEQFHFVQVNDTGQGIRHWASIGLDDLFHQLGVEDSTPG